MFQPDAKPVSTAAPWGIELVQARAALQDERKGSIADDLIGGDFARAETELHWDTAVAEAGSRWAPLDHAGTRKLLTLYIATGAGSATCRGNRGDFVATGSG